MIVFDAVTKRYPGAPGAGPGEPAPAAVDSFSATIERGSVTVLLGSSGCGKTTLLRMVNRMVEPTAGRVLVDGQDVAATDPVALRRSIGYVMQDAGLLPHRRVLDNVTTVPRLTGTPRDVAEARALDLMDRVGLDRSLARRYPHQLSGGQAQRVGVARALAADPEVLLMDEPFGAVDPLVRGELQDELLHLQGELAKTILFVTHDVDEALHLGDYVIVLREGAAIAQRGTGPELLAAPADAFVSRFLGLDRGARSLTLQRTHADQAVVVDRAGRAVGRLADGAGPGAPPGHGGAPPGPTAEVGSAFDADRPPHAEPGQQVSGA